MKRILATAGLALALAGAEAARAEPLSLGSPVIRTGERFEWQAAYTQRAAGTYGQAEVALTGGVAYEFFTESAAGGTSADPYLYVLNGAGTSILAEDDDSGIGYNPAIAFTPGTTGTYLVRLRAYTRGTWGTCSFTLRKKAAPAPEQEFALSPGDILHDQVFEWRSSYTRRYSGSYGEYSVEMQGGTFYTFETSDASGGGEDTYLYLVNDRGRVVAADDDSGDGYHSRLAFRPGADATYYLRLRAYTRGNRGTCTLSLEAGDRPPGTPLLPDLLTWRDAMEDAYVSTAGGVRRLRFSNAVANRGAGPLDVYGVVDSDGTTQAFQQVYNDDGSRTVFHVGTFSFAGHADHGHWHYDDFSTYRLVDPSTGAEVASSGKVSFCLEDVRRYTDESLPGGPSSAVYSCTRQGISRGWADVYGAQLDGQDIPLAGVADGTYDLVSTTNPDGRLVETSTANDTATLRIRISGTSVQIVQ